MRRNKKGFTLIEIIVVVVILTVLMAVAVPTVLSYIDTANEAPALAECRAIITATQKRVVDKYAQTRNENISINSDDIEWIEKFVDDVTGQIQGSVTIKNKEVKRLLYKASNGLYVLYDNQTFTIVTEDDINKTILGQLDQMTIDYTALTKELIGDKTFLDRNVIIKQLIDGGGLTKVDEKLTEKALGNTNTSLYWRPYYLGNTKDPQLIMYANMNNTNETNWNSNLMYINGKLYKTNHNISSYYKDYKTIASLEEEISKNPDKYSLIEIDE